MRRATLALLLTLASFAHGQEIEPDQGRMVEVTRNPDALWAMIINPSTRYDDRMRAAVMAKEVLPPRFIPKFIAAKFALEEERWNHYWWVRPVTNIMVRPAPHLPERVAPRVVLGFDWQPPPQPIDEPRTIEELRAAPWPWQVERALEKVDIPIGDAAGIDIVRDLPCADFRQENAILETVKRFPFTAETYGAVYNIVVADPSGRWFTPDLPDWWTFHDGDDWYAAQAFIAIMARNDARKIMMVTEIPNTVSYDLRALEKMIVAMREPGGPFPYTAYLAMADRIVSEAQRESGMNCMLALDAARLVQVLDAPPVSDEPSFREQDSCTKWLEQFQDMLREQRPVLETGAAAEKARIAEARTRMSRVSLCRK